MTKVLTLCLIRDGERMLLGIKKRGFGAGRWNGFGGKVEEGETVEDAARREVREEVGLDADALVPVGLLHFSFARGGNELEVHVFDVTSWTGEPAETEEMRPQWFALTDIPFDDMWSDDRHWFPLYLAGKKFRGRFHLGDEDMILEQELHEVDF